VETSRTAMTDIDPSAEIAIGHVYDVHQDRDEDHLVVCIPLADHVDQGWIRWYHRLARGKGIVVRAEDRPDGGMVRVDVPAYIDREKIRALLNTVRALVKEADAAAERPPPMAEAEYAVLEWWSEQWR
jgi:hypothetical protein